MYLLTNVITIVTFSFHVPSTRISMRNKFHVARLMNTENGIFAVVETFFFH